MASNVENSVKSSLHVDPRMDEWFKDEEAKRARNVKAKLRNGREKLPIFPYKDHLTENIAKNGIVLIKGETGCGKTTQVPQYILEDCADREVGSMTNVLVTQPRRISAMSVANRVAEERGERIGAKSRQVSFDEKSDSFKNC